MKKLNIGCGSRPVWGWVNHDRTRHSPHVDLAFDLEEPVWNVADRFDEIAAKDVLEHVQPSRLFGVMNRLWELLLTGGLLKVQVPQWGSANAVIDPTHWRGFHLQSFDIFDPTTRLGRINSFYGLRPWTVVSRQVVPRSDVNLQFELRK